MSEKPSPQVPPDDNINQGESKREEKRSTETGLKAIISLLEAIYHRDQETGIGSKKYSKHLSETVDSLENRSQQITGIIREDFISPLNQAVEAVNLSDKIQGGIDNSIYQVKYSDGKITIIVFRHENRGNPFSDPNVMLSTLDMRDTSAWTYEWDGDETITGVEPTGEETIITDEKWGKPEAILEMWHQHDWIGSKCGSEEFTKE